MKKLDNVTRNFRVCCVGIMAIGVVMYVTASFFK